jgi:beta-glucosidase
MMGIMPGHNEIDGVPSHGNAWLLQEQLRREWGFDGVVVSDMEDVFRLYHFHHVAKDSSEAAAIALENGISLDLCIQNRAYNALGEAFFERHPHLMEKLDDAVRNVLRTKYRLNLFENPYTKEDPAVFQIQKSQHTQTAKQSAAQGNILLKNDGILPLDAGKIKKLAVIGPNAFPVQCGAYGRNSGISFYEGLRDSLPEAEVRLARGCNITNADAMEFSQASALLKAGNSQKQKDVGLWQEDVVAAAKNLQIASVDPKLISDDENSQLIGEAVEAAVWADAVVLCVGGNNYTARESFYIPDKHLGDRDDLSLPGSQSLLIQKVCAVGKPVVLVLNHGRSNLVEKEINLCQAAVETWFAGEYSGEALARQLLGYDNFSGKLTVTIPRRNGQLPVVYNAKPSSHLKGYLFSDNRVLYPFGYGLSYSSYTYSDLKLSCESMPPDGVCTASVTVKNTSNQDGEETVQMYIRDEVSSVARPVKELRGFEKVFIPAGEKRTVSFTISKELLEFTDVNYHRTVEPGLFEIMIGQNSEETLKAKLLVTEKAS